MVKNEVSRMIEFKRLSLNKMESDKLIYNIIDTYHLSDDDEFKEEEYYE